MEIRDASVAEAYLKFFEEMWNFSKPVVSVEPLPRQLTDTVADEGDLEDGLGEGVVLLQHLRPTSRAVIDAQDVYFPGFHAIWDDEWGFWNEKLARARHATGAAEAGIIGDHDFNCIENARQNTSRGRRIICGDERFYGGQIGVRFG